MDRVCYNHVKKILQPYSLGGLTVVDIGAKDFNGSCKSLFIGSRYIGLDIEAGKNVDVVMEDPKIIPLQNEFANIVVCLSVLEHCANPFALMSEMSRITKFNGTIIVCVPQVWGLHDYPHDYWRINPDGIRELFNVSGITPRDIHTKCQFTIRHGILKMTYGVGHKLAVTKK